MTETMTAVQLPELTVDRSPELRRSAGRPASGLLLQFAELDPAEASAMAAESEPGNGATCAVANFIRRQLPGCDPHIEGEHPYVSYKGIRMDVMLSPGIVEDIGKFDRAVSRVRSRAASSGRCEGVHGESLV